MYISGNKGGCEHFIDVVDTGGINKDREINIVNTSENRESNIKHIVTNKYIVIECVLFSPYMSHDRK